jgi:hypothetical protein
MENIFPKFLCRYITFPLLFFWQNKQFWNGIFTFKFFFFHLQKTWKMIFVYIIKKNIIIINNILINGL